jgi:hypothetical protein
LDGGRRDRLGGTHGVWGRNLDELAGDRRCDRDGANRGRQGGVDGGGDSGRSVFG